MLDTWFSSGLWPFSTLGWPEQTRDLAYFYPNTIMETGYDILFFWVARMIMSGLEYDRRDPLRQWSTCTAWCAMTQGQKMSKTKGNVIDPLIVMDDLGTDALTLHAAGGFYTRQGHQPEPEKSGGQPQLCQ